METYEWHLGEEDSGTVAGLILLLLTLSTEKGDSIGALLPGRKEGGEPSKRRSESLLRAALACLILMTVAGPVGARQEDSILDSLRAGQEQIIQGNLDAAEKLLGDLIRQAPADPRAYNMLGVVAVQKGNPESAEAHFLKAVELAPGFVGALLNLGRLYQERPAADKQALDKGVTCYLQVLQSVPDHLDARFQVALLLHLKGEWKESLFHLEQLGAEAGSRPRAALLAAANHAAEGDLEQSQTELETAMSGRLDEVDLLQVLPAFQAGGGESLALALLEWFTRQNRSSVGLRERLGWLYSQLGEYEKARITLESLSGEHPELPELLVELATVSFKQGDFDRTLSYLAHARDLRPLDSRIHLFFGITCSEKGLGLEALKSLEQAVSLEPENPYYNYALGAAALYWREAGEAIPYFEKYCTARPDDIRGVTALAQARFINKEYDKAREGFERVVNDPGMAATANYYLGVIARMEQRFDEAVAYLEKNLAVYPGNPDALAEMGAIYTRERDFERAEKVLLEAIGKSPDHYQANFSLLTLYARTKDERYDDQKAKFDQIKENRWNELTESLRTIEVVPPAVFLETGPQQ